MYQLTVIYPHAGGLRPALRATDYKCPHWIWEIEDEAEGIQNHGNTQSQP